MANRDHGGGLDQAIAKYGGVRKDWIDLSTGINPNCYPIGPIPQHFWTDLPDSAAQSELIAAAREFWNVPKDAAIIPASGVSAIISALPELGTGDKVNIPKPTYNEHEAAFRNHGFVTSNDAPNQVFVHPNNPDGKLYSEKEITDGHKNLSIIDESFCDTNPDQSHIRLAGKDGFVFLKGLGKFWGLAGIRLGFAITSHALAEKMVDRLGPWAISGPAQFVGAQALRDFEWAKATRSELSEKADRLDKILTQSGATSPTGTSLFRLYEVEAPNKLQDHLARNQIWSRTFPYSNRWIRLGIPGSSKDWDRLNSALRGFV